MSETGNFDRVARIYQWVEYATFASSLQRCRTYFLPELQDSKRALILGDGDSRFTSALFKLNLQVEADVIDLSATMLALLGRRTLASQSRIQLHLMDALKFRTSSEYDLVVTHFFLDCLSEASVQELVGNIRTMMHPNALWLVSEFHIPPGPMGPFARLLVRILYSVFRLLTGLKTSQLPDYATVFQRNGLTRIGLRRSLGGLLSSELWRLD